MSSRLNSKQRDFVLVNIFVLAQHGYIERAATLAEAMYLAGEISPEVLLARAVLRFFNCEWQATLAILDDLDRLAPIERFGDYRLNDRQRMRRYLKARCLHELKDKLRARDALEVYLRHADPPVETIG